MTAPPSFGPFRNCRVHLIGIGGCGMSGAAAMLLQMGADVSGSDMGDFEGLGTLVSRGARIAIGHRSDLVQPGTDLVVISAAVPDTNPELVEARRRNLPVIKYAELLGRLMSHRVGVAIAGTHGKSTTTALAAWLLRNAGLNPSFIFGAKSDQLGGPSGVDRGKHFVVEACEFDRSFLQLRPRLAAILNVERDHLDCYMSFDELVDAFALFAGQVAPDGLLVCNSNDPIAIQAAAATAATIETFGFDEAADWRAIHLECDLGRFRFDVAYRGKVLLSTHLSIPGRFNVANALAATALAHHAGADEDDLAAAMPDFLGIQRRLSWCGYGQGVTIVDDYAHHPTEIKVTIGAARDRYQPKRMFVVFQPHQYARTCDLMDEFADSFADADEIIVPDIYAAREPGARVAEGSAKLVERICAHGRQARYLPTLADVAQTVVDEVRDGDLVVTMGAGDVWKIAHELVEKLCGPDATGCAAGTHDLVPAGRQRPMPVPAA
ncbi:MAG: UDP-N-acetylmuramate--L-alanine ligase [Phycisphaerae bacterium]